MCIGRSASPSAPIATSTPMCATAASTKPSSLALICSELEAFRGAGAWPHRDQHLLRRRHAVADGRANRRRDPRRDRGAMDRRRRRRDHARGQSHQRRGDALRRLPRRRRQSRLARRAVARRREPQGARAQAYERRGARRARRRQGQFRARLVRPDLCADGTNGAGLARRACPRASVTPTTTFRSISSPSSQARRSPRVTPPAA